MEANDGAARGLGLREVPNVERLGAQSLFILRREEALMDIQAAKKRCEAATNG